MKVGILQNEDDNSSKKWEIACQKKKIDYEIIDLSASDWLENIQSEKFDFFLLRPSGSLSHYKTMYDERIYILSKVLNFKLYPSYEEAYIYENKKLLSYYLKACNIPHPKTVVFYSKQEAIKFAANTDLPIVAKTSIGASGSGVKILKTKEQLEKYIKDAFSKKGIKSRFGPNRVTGSPKKWFMKALQSPAYFKYKLKKYLTGYSHGQRDFVIFQEFIQHDFEWRAVKIGESYFAHKKIKHGEKASGSKGIDYVEPPESILNFLKKICDKNNFNFMSVDIFEDGKGGYLVNELQTIFGHVQDYICSVNGKPGRYLYKENKWIFELGDFNTNESYDLRLETAIKLYNEKK